ncbi:MAG: phenylalanine--tRNA ligase subunit beta [Pirellulales bacterium]
MLVSWNWLREYLPPLAITADELVERLAMAGLNHESTTHVDGDLAIDIEVTSNRADCLGHLGIAREAAVLTGTELKMPDAQPVVKGPPVASLVKVRLDCPELCPRYTARVIRGIKIGPSPAWLQKRLHAIGQPAINNVVDATNYVLMECGQPLHAFDLAKLAGADKNMPEIIVRDARPQEKFLAIDHAEYEIAPGMCVIADARTAVALGGVMGGASSEVTDQTRDLLIESAEFDPLAIRTTARRVGLHSDSSYRFERGIDPEGVEWASRRVCQLILELAGGELAEGILDVGRVPPPREPVRLRFDQIRRVLGIDIDPAETRRILLALGNQEQRADERELLVIPPSWRRDLSREIDLIEEVARVHGYEAIPEDVPIAMVSSSRSKTDRVLERVRAALVASGFCEAMTLSAVPEEWSAAWSPWTTSEALRCVPPILRGADCLRRSVVPSLLDARRLNDAASNEGSDLFEIARAYLPRDGAPPDEPLLLALVSSRGFHELKGVLQTILSSLSPSAELSVAPIVDALFDEEKACELLVAGERWGFLGEVAADALSQFGLRSATTVAEVKVPMLVDIAELVPKAVPLVSFPPLDRDLNLVVDDAVRWADLEKTVRTAAGEAFEQLTYRETYRNPKDPQLGAGRKSLLMTLRLRSPRGTLTGEEADQIREAIVAACRAAHGAELRA